jgi:hypothetical protein
LMCAKGVVEIMGKSTPTLMLVSDDLDFALIGIINPRAPGARSRPRNERAQRVHSTPPLAGGA